jgi:hypothetical protein
MQIRKNSRYNEDGEGGGKKDSKKINEPKNVDIVFLIDAIGSMGYEITAAKDNNHQLN